MNFLKIDFFRMHLLSFFSRQIPKKNIYFLLISYFCFCIVLDLFSLEISNTSDFCAKKVVYTSICGNYDSLVTQSYMHNGWDYICFTDNEELLEKGHMQWTIRPLKYTERDNTRNSRWHKMFPDLILPEYDISFYIDGNINIKDSRIFDYIDIELLNNELESLAINRHPIRNCIYQEAIVCKKLSFDSSDVIDSQMSAIFVISSKVCRLD